MSIRAVVVFLLVMVALALVRGPAFRRTIRNLLGIGRRDR
jgi:hypothetical protein